MTEPRATITHAAASAAILAHCDAGTIVQRVWHGLDAAGRAVACLLGAIDPSVEKPEDCNAALMPAWLAEVTPVLFDELPPAAVYPIARRYGEMVGRWHRLSDAQWRGILATFLCAVIDIAADAARPIGEDKPYWPAIAAVCEQSKAAIQSGGGTGAWADTAWDAAWDAAWAAAWAADAARATVEDVAQAAAWAAAWAATEAAGWNADDACQQLFTRLLDQIESESDAAADGAPLPAPPQ